MKTELAIGLWNILLVFLIFFVVVKISEQHTYPLLVRWILAIGAIIGISLLMIAE
jgi:uncharacterized membrane protein YczE